MATEDVKIDLTETSSNAEQKAANSLGAETSPPASAETSKAEKIDYKSNDFGAKIHLLDLLKHKNNRLFIQSHGTKENDKSSFERWISEVQKSELSDNEEVFTIQSHVL